MGNLKPNAIIVASFTWVILAKAQVICVIILKNVHGWSLKM